MTICFHRVLVCDHASISKNFIFLNWCKLFYLSYFRILKYVRHCVKGKWLFYFSYENTTMTFFWFRLHIDSVHWSLGRSMHPRKGRMILGCGHNLSISLPLTFDYHTFCNINILFGLNGTVVFISKAPFKIACEMGKKCCSSCQFKLYMILAAHFCCWNLKVYANKTDCENWLS